MSQKSNTTEILQRVICSNDIHWIVSILSECPELVRNVERLGGALIPLAELEDVKWSITGSPSRTYSFLTSILSRWISKEGHNFRNLVSVLKQEDFISAAEAILQKLQDRSCLSLSNAGQDNSGGIYFGIRDPIELFTGREQELEQIKKCFNDKSLATGCVVIVGLGGIGKSELARMYIHKNKSKYMNLIWINAENYNSMVRSFKELAQNELNITLKNIDGDERDIRYIVKDVYGSQVFSCTTLIVFDNAEKYRSEFGDDGIIDFLPPSSIPNYHTLITSRNSEWGSNIASCRLGTFTSEDARRLIKHDGALGKDKNLRHADMDRLGNTLQYFPLALQQAIAYIKQSDEEIRDLNPLSRYGISDYLSEYRTRKMEVLSFNLPEYINDRYVHTVTTTWEITFAKIKQETNGNMAANVLNVCAYLAPDNIPAEMLIQRNSDERDLRSILRILKKYSMIDVSNGVISIHRLVQDVVRFKIEHERLQSTVILGIFKKLNTIFPPGESVDDYVQRRKLLVHLETFLSRVDSYLADSSNRDSEDPKCEKILFNYYEFKTILGSVFLQFGHALKASRIFEEELVRLVGVYGPDSYMLAKTMESLARAYGRLGIYQKENEMLKEVVAIREKEFGVDHIDVFKALKYLGNSYGSLGYGEKKVELLERALKLTEIHYGPDHFETGSTLGHLGNAYNNIKNYSHGKDLLERALAIIERQYGNENIEYAKTLANLGITYCDLRDDRKGVECLEKALSIKEKYYGQNKFFVGRTLGDLGNAYRKSGDNIKAKDMLERAVLVIEQHYGPHHIQLFSTLKNLAMAYDGLGNIRMKEELLRRTSLIGEKHKLNSHDLQWSNRTPFSNRKFLLSQAFGTQH